MFDDEKIKLIESMPDGDSILIIWIRLLTLAGKVNDEGFVYLNEHMPYTPEMLSTIFGRKLSTVKLALSTFESLEMIETFDGKVMIKNWTKHQNVEGLADIKRKEQARLRQAKHRAKKKQLVTPDVTLQSRDESRKITSLELDLDLEGDRELEKEKPLSSDVPSDLVKDVVAYLNEKTGKAFKPASKKTQLLIKARVKDLSVGLDDFKKVIDVKCEQWLDDPKYSKYLQPTTLFGTKFEGYLNEWVEPKKQERSYKLFGDDPADLEGIDIDNVPF
jgi:predicted phage replisome organizer/uncharacterized phage protein (TIGR02220 family)